MTLKLFVQKDGEEEKILATTPSGLMYNDDGSIAKARQYLLGQQNDWIQNGGPEYVAAKYRIADDSRSYR